MLKRSTHRLALIRGLSVGVKALRARLSAAAIDRHATARSVYLTQCCIQLVGNVTEYYGPATQQPGHRTVKRLTEVVAARSGAVVGVSVRVRVVKPDGSLRGIWPRWWVHV